jgi:class 3 adenylate cyclase
MRCSKCGAENREGRRFCRSCGSKLGTVCPQCGAANEVGENFCGDCGAALSDSSAIAPAHTESLPQRGHVTDRIPDASEGFTSTRDTRAGERRHLTVLFCDLVGSTEIAARLDPEEWRDTVAGYHRAATDVINSFGGRIAKYLGDGVMAYFGYPEAHDNDAERAVRAALATHDALSKLNKQAVRSALSARIGIHSGAVVVGAGASKEDDVFGDAPNVAARVQAAAEPGSILITADTTRLIAGLFEIEDLGAPPLKGVERPVQLYRVIQQRRVRGRLQAAAAARGLTPFIGREDELHSLMNRWERVLDGEGQVVLVVGEAGIGKSRLVQHFQEQIADTAHTWVEAAAAPFYQNTPFYPVAEILRGLGSWSRDESPERQIGGLERALEEAGLRPAAAIPLIAPLVNLPVPVKYPRRCSRPSNSAGGF